MRALGISHRILTMLRKAALWGSVFAVVVSAVALGSACSGKDNETPAPGPVDSGTGDTAVEDVKIDTKDAAPKDTALPPCDPGTVRCGENCVDTMTSTFNCGSCGFACTGSYSCVGGKCACAGKLPDECKTIDDAGTELGGICVNLKTDPANCGTCKNACGTGGKCVDGACVGGA